MYSKMTSYRYTCAFERAFINNMVDATMVHIWKGYLFCSERQHQTLPTANERHATVK